MSGKENLPRAQWCYEPNKDGKFAEGMKPAADYLDRKGYRLPSEAEWEFACRSGTVTSRYYGATDRLLNSYAYFQGNASDRAWPAGSLKPNDFGLFDMLGNAMEWCHNRGFTYPTGKGEDLPDGDAVTDKESRVLRGGSFIFQSRFVRCASRFHLQLERAALRSISQTDMRSPRPVPLSDRFHAEPGGHVAGRGRRGLPVVNRAALPSLMGRQ